MKRVVLLAAAAAACATVPPTAPQIPAPPAWSVQIPDAAGAEDHWWRVDGADPTLAQLLDRAGDAAQVAAAHARRDQAAALLRAAQAAMGPRISVTSAAGAAAADSGGASTSSGELAAAYAINLAGAERLRARSAEAALAAEDAALQAARLQTRTLAARLFIAQRTAQAQRQAASETLQAAEHSLALAQTRAGAGLETFLAAAQARTARDLAAARLPGLDQAAAQARLGLEALLGTPIGGLVEALDAAPPEVEIALLIDRPAAVLARRPDVRAAAARAQAAGYDAAAAHADRWPSLSIGALAGVASASQAAFPPVEGTTARGLASLTQTLFDAGRLAALADAAGAEAAAQGELYRQSVRDALADVEIALDRTLNANATVQARRAALASAQDQTGLTRARYAAGLTSFLDVLAADAALAQARAGLAQAQGEAADAAVLLAAALGLGAEP